MKDMRIYVASLSDYNNGRLEGKWLDLADYSDASELMEAIQEMLDELTEKYKSVDGEVREEWAVHDYEGIPSTLASEYMSEQDFQQLYDIAEVADDRGIPVEVLVERAGDTGSDDYQALADSLMFVVDGYDESDIVAEYESQLGELGSDFWSNHIYIDDVTERVLYGEDVDRFREDILSENPDIDEDEAERQAEEMADEEAERREDLTTYLEDMGYGDSIPDFVSKDYEGAWKRSLSYDFDVINHDGEMYVFSNNYSLGGTILSGMIGAYIGYKIGRAKPQKKGFETEKRIGRKIKGALTKNKMAKGGGVYSSDSMYELKVFDGKSNEFLTSVRYRARNQREANEIGQDYEYEMQQKYGDYLRFVVSEAKPLMARGGSTSKSDLDILIDEINEKSGGRFYLGGAYGNYELWGKDKDGGDHRIEVGSRKDIREALIKNRYNSKFTEYAKGGNINTGRSWHQDRRMHNKSERYEKPMNSRKRQFAEGGNIFKGSRGKNQKVQNWYIKNYPTDDLGQELNDQITFDGLWRMMNQRYDFYDLIDVADSLVRERVFSQIAKIYGIDYDLVYDTWLKGSHYAKGGGVDGKMNFYVAEGTIYWSDESGEYQRFYTRNHIKAESKEKAKMIFIRYIENQTRTNEWDWAEDDIFIEPATDSDEVIEFRGYLSAKDYGGLSKDKFSIDRFSKGGGVDYPNHYLEVEDLNQKINSLTQQIEADYRNNEIDNYTDRNERELVRLKERLDWLMWGKDSYSQGGGISGLNDLIRG